MKILVFVSGYIKHGLCSPTSGEGSWGLGLAEMLAEHGHQIDCIANAPCDPPSWGDTTPVPNINFYPVFDPNKDYDLVLYTPWENMAVGDRGSYGACTTLPIKAKWFAHCTYSWSPSINNRECAKGNHVLCYAFVQDGNSFPPTGPDNWFRTFALPKPVYKELAPLNLGKRDVIFWTCKGVFHPDWPKDHYLPEMGVRALKALKRISDECGNPPIYFLDGDYFRNSATSKRLGVMDIVSQIPNAQLINTWLPKNEFLGLLSRTRVSVIIAGLAGGNYECIAMGATPLCFTGHLYRKPAERFGLKLDTYQATEDEIYNCIKKLYTDDAFNTEVIAAYQQEMSCYKHDTVYYNYFVPMVKSLGLTV